MSSRSITIRSVAAACALLVGLAACGDDDPVDDRGADRTDETTTTTDAPTTTTEADVPDEPTDAAADDPPLDDPGEHDGGDPLVFVADLTGDTEVPGPGDTGGEGRIEIESVVAGEWCIDMEATGLSSDVTDAHVHFGPTGNSGDAVIPIGKPTSSQGETDTWTDVCVAVADDLVAEIVDAPEAFYANIHTVDFGGGAIRGQLAASSIFDLELS